MRVRAALACGLVVAALGGRAEAQREPGWELRVPERVELALGEAGALPIALALDRGLTVSKDAAVIVDLAPAAGVAMRKRRLGRGDAVDPEADAPRFAAAMRGEVAGEHVVAVRVRLWLCGGRVCRPLDVRRTATVVVTPPAPPPAPPAPDAGG